MDAVTVLWDTTTVIAGTKESEVSCTYYYERMSQLELVVSPHFVVRQNGNFFTFLPASFVHFMHDDRARDPSRNMCGNVLRLVMYFVSIL